MSAQLESIKKNFGYDPTSPKWISRGGELMKHLGTEVMRIEFKKEGEEWKSSAGQALLLQANAYDPETETVVLVWKDVDYSKPEEEWEVKETRIFPPGFSFENPEESGCVTRFLPYSLHTEKVETETYFTKLKYLFNVEGDESKAMTLGLLKSIASSGGRVNTLCHIHYIAVVVKPVGEDAIYTFRLGDIGIRHQFKSVWKVTAKDDTGKHELTLWIDDADPTNPTRTLEMRDAGNKVEAEVKFFDLRTAFLVGIPLPKPKNKIEE